MSKTRQKREKMSISDQAQAVITDFKKQIEPLEKMPMSDEMQIMMKDVNKIYILLKKLADNIIACEQERHNPKKSSNE